MRADWRRLDWLAAAVLSVGALSDAVVDSRHALRPVPTGSLLLLAASVAWARQRPVPVAAVATTALALLVFSDFRTGNWLALAVDLAIVWDFFFLGYRGPDGRHPVLAGVLLCWLAVSLTTGWELPSGQAGLSAGGPASTVSFWALSGILPFAVGCIIAARNVRNGDLAQATDELQADQAVHAQLAASAERAKMARELHDVVAHCVSVMVVQTSGARRMAGSDLDKAREALRVVEAAGREALVELRRIVGVLHRADTDAEGLVAPGLGQLESLLRRVRLAGLPVEFRVEGPVRPLPRGIQLAVFRIAQEALTNTLKHAGGARADVVLGFDDRELVLTVRDDGRGSVGQPPGASGHGLVGMRERVNLYGGQLYAGPGRGGGFEIEARIPLDGGHLRAPRHPGPLRSDTRSNDTEARASLPLPWLDPVLGLAFLSALEVTALVSVRQGGIRARDMALVAVMAGACLWRRRRPLWFVLAAVAPVFALSGQLAPRNCIVTALYVGLMPSYAVAAWSSRHRAWAGLAILLSSSALAQVLLHHLGSANYAGPAFAITAAWVSGRAVSRRRRETQRLERRARQLSAERDTRAELAVARERSRIARELHAIVAHSVAAMVIQAEVARSQLERHLTTVDETFESIQSTGRQALEEMRRILGVLRHHDETDDLLPQPGIDQLYPLIQRARDRGARVEFRVTGEPGALSAGVELTIYRAVEDALDELVRQPASMMDTELRFGKDSVELLMNVTGADLQDWPTGSMHERIAICGGDISMSSPDGRERLITARLPQASLGVPA